MSNSVQSFRLRVEKSVGNKELNTLGAVLKKVQALTSNLRSSSEELAQAIGSDSVLTAKVLRTVNSAYFGLHRHISSVDEAVVLLGYGQLRGLCAALLSAGFMGLDKREGDFDRVSLWKHALGTGTASGVLQKRFGLDGIDCFTAGLLSNIGRIILDQYFHDDFMRALEYSRSNKVSLNEAESKVFGVSHAEVGFWAAELWGFDEGLAHVIRHHHGPSVSRATDIVNFAYVVTQAKMVGAPGDRKLTRFLPGLLGRLSLNDQALDEILVQLNSEYRMLEPMFRAVEK